MSDFRERFAKMLHDDYLHKQHDDLYCALCGKKGGKLALHVIEYTQDINEPLPKYFVPMSSSGGRIRGSFAVCDSCAPACKKCDLPIQTEKVMKFMKQKRKEFQGDYTLMYGNGICRHIQLGLFIKLLIKKLFHIN